MCEGFGALADAGPMSVASGAWEKGSVLVEVVTTGDITGRRGATKRRKGRGMGDGRAQYLRTGN